MEQPPRARGRRDHGPVLAVDRRATPASAGPTQRRGGETRRPGSNPRERGADLAIWSCTPSRGEQPPRARGRPAARSRRRRPGRATSASAGPTRLFRRLKRLAWSNPRERGADGRLAVKPDLPEEQPPRARGRRVSEIPRHMFMGATPASAGPTATLNGTASRRRSNPRERGADELLQDGGLGTEEQPPRARGRLFARRLQQSRSGATPASAGPTGPDGPHDRPAGSNPRERGADVVGVTGGKVEEEQPPRARGRPVGGRLGGLLGGATPASAGPTLPDLR